MSETDAFLLGLIQGLTEFLPVSSSGHLEIGKYLLITSGSENLTFTLLVHVATVLSTIVIFFRDIRKLLINSLSVKMNDHTRYLFKLLLSALPVGIIGIFFRKEVESLFTGNLLLVGICLLVTSLLLAFAFWKKENIVKPIGWKDSLIIGISQAFAVLPGLSRSGSTIATALLLGKERKEAARFSFLMVILPILGAILLDLLTMDFSKVTGIGTLPLIIGFLTAFISGMAACRWMISIVSGGKLIYFSVYCLIAGLFALIIPFI